MFKVGLHKFFKTISCGLQLNKYADSCLFTMVKQKQVFYCGKMKAGFKAETKFLHAVKNT